MLFLYICLFNESFLNSRSLLIELRITINIVTRAFKMNVINLAAINASKYFNANNTTVYFQHSGRPEVNKVDPGNKTAAAFLLRQEQLSTKAGARL